MTEFSDTEKFSILGFKVLINALSISNMRVKGRGRVKKFTWVRDIPLNEKYLGIHHERTM